MKVRQYNENDITQVLHLHRIALEDIGVYKGDGPWDDDLKDILNNYRNGIFLIGEIDNKLITMGAFKKIDENICEIKRMRTDPFYQGNGYGKTILEELIIKAKEMKYKEIVLETSEKQIPAIKLYKNAGFKEYKKEIIDGYNCAWYKLNLL